jgi:hypothetical protein
LTVLHASFANYLKDRSRSGDFHVGNSRDIEEDVILRLSESWNKCSGDDIATGMHGLFVFITNIDVIFVSASVESTWYQYCSKVDDRTDAIAGR